MVFLIIQKPERHGGSRGGAPVTSQVLFVTRGSGGVTRGPPATSRHSVPRDPPATVSQGLFRDPVTPRDVEFAAFGSREKLQKDRIPEGATDCCKQIRCVFKEVSADLFLVVSSAYTPSSMCKTGMLSVANRACCATCTSRFCQSWERFSSSFFLNTIISSGAVPLEVQDRLGMLNSNSKIMAIGSCLLTLRFFDRAFFNRVHRWIGMHSQELHL